MEIDGATITFFLLTAFVVWRLIAVLGSHNYDSKKAPARSLMHFGRNPSNGVRYQFSKSNKNFFLKKYLNRYSEWFSFKGEIRGLNYWNRIISFIFIMLFVPLILFLVWSSIAVFLLRILPFEIIFHAVKFLGAIFILSFSVAFYWILIATLVKRCRDIGLHLGLAFLVALPVWIFIGVIILGLLPSNDQKK